MQPVIASKQEQDSGASAWLSRGDLTFYLTIVRTCFLTALNQMDTKG